MASVECDTALPLWPEGSLVAFGRQSFVFGKEELKLMFLCLLEANITPKPLYYIQRLGALVVPASWLKPAQSRSFRITLSVSIRWAEGSVILRLLQHTPKPILTP